MSIRISTRVSRNTSVSFPLSWVVAGVLIAIALAAGAVGTVVAYVVGHPMKALGELAEGVLFFSLLGAGLYGVCWLLAHRGQRTG